MPLPFLKNEAPESDFLGLLSAGVTSGAVGSNMPLIPVGDGESRQSLNARAQQRVTANVPATANEIQVSWFPVITPRSAGSGDA